MQALVIKKTEEIHEAICFTMLLCPYRKRNAAVITGADTGPAREPNDVPDEMHVDPSSGRKKQEDRDELNDSIYGEFIRCGGSPCSKDPYNTDDQKADATYSPIDDRMEERYREYCKKRDRGETENYQRERPKTQRQFTVLKRDLASVSESK
ncbi:hypothetical protein P879_06488 [Paragonimus westermani]|uniref:PRP1 splicing factor N-terminal domain-containing protein n=1 Tax=Paragonimus westermani TaxID=34504 RepID=A0A8T0DBH2_9TREM|nr:hypothetical protein P879_06488 [Paragonimus westermani]